MRLERLLWKRFTAATPDGPLGRRAMRTPAPLDIMAALRAHHGTQRAAAEAAGIGRSTWGHVLRGRAPSAATRGRLLTAWRSLLTRHAAAFATWPGIVLRAEVKISDDVRTRCLNVGRWTDGASRRRFDDYQGAVVDAWLAGNDARAAELFATPVMEGLNLNAGQHVFVLDALDLRYFETQSAADTWVRANPPIHPR